MVLVKINIVSISVTKKESYATIKKRHSILRWIIGIAVTKSIEREVKIRCPILVID